MIIERNRKYENCKQKPAPITGNFKVNQMLKVRIIGSSSYRRIGFPYHMYSNVFSPRGNQFWFELARASSYRGFESPGVNCLNWHYLCNWSFRRSFSSCLNFSTTVFKKVIWNHPENTIVCFNVYFQDLAKPSILETKKSKLSSSQTPSKPIKLHM